MFLEQELIFWFGHSDSSFARSLVVFRDYSFSFFCHRKSSVVHVWSCRWGDDGWVLYSGERVLSFCSFLDSCLLRFAVGASSVVMAVPPTRRSVLQAARFVGDR